MAEAVAVAVIARVYDGRGAAGAASYHLAHRVAVGRAVDDETYEGFKALFPRPVNFRDGVAGDAEEDAAAAEEFG